MMSDMEIKAKRAAAKASVPQDKMDIMDDCNWFAEEP